MPNAGAWIETIVDRKAYKAVAAHIAVRHKKQRNKVKYNEMKFTLHNNLVIENITDEQRHVIKQNMSFINPKYIEAQQFGRKTYGIRRIIRLYNDKNNKLTLPRGALYKIVGLVGPPTDFIDERAKLNKVYIPSKIELRPLQAPWVEDMLKHFQGVGVSAAGSGKTVMALEVISRIGLPSLWLTHRQALVDQLIERAAFFYGEIPPIGVIGGGKFDIGEVLTAGMIQTLAKRDLTDLKYRFGTVVVDETHLVPCMMAQKVLSQIAPEYLYGITATPYREDSMDQVIFDTIGPIIANTDRQEIVDAKDIMPAKVIVRQTGINYFGKEYNEVIDCLVTNQKRNTMIIIDILTEVALGNICIVLTNRVEHGKLIKDTLEQLGTDSIHLHARTTSKQRKNGFDRFKSGEAAVLIATYKFLAEGFDHRPTNRIFFTLPYKARGLIEQAKGRIERTYPGKVDAILYDYVDSVPFLVRQFESRLEQYHEHDLEIIF